MCDGHSIQVQHAKIQQKIVDKPGESVPISFIRVRASYLEPQCIEDDSKILMKQKLLAQRTAHRDLHIVRGLHTTEMIYLHAELR